MTESTPPGGRTRIAVLKLLYLLAVTAIVFAVPDFVATRPARWYVLPALMAIQAAILLRCGVSPRAVARAASRLKWLFAILIACYAFLPGDDGRSGDDWRQVPLAFLGRSVGVNLGGLSLASLMCVQILTVILASAVVRLTGSGKDLVDGLRALGLPALFVHALDQTLGQLGGLQHRGQGAGGGTGGGDGLGGRRQAAHAGMPGANSPSPGFFAIVRRLIWGDVGPFLQAIRGSLERATEQVRRDVGGQLDGRLAHDVAIVTGAGLVMVSLKILKALPGVPFASGHKTLLFFPLYILAARRTHTRWGGTAAGAVMGVIGFLQGDGRFGVLDVLKHLAPGLLIDLMMPIVGRLPQSAWVYCGLGFLAAIARTATEFAVVLLLGARAEVYVFPAARLVPNLIAGTLSGFVTVAVLKAFPLREADSPTDHALAPAEGPGTTRPSADPTDRPELITARPTGGGEPRDGREEDS